MRNEKTFFKWRSNLRHVTMLLMALFLCIGNAWGADYYAYLTIAKPTAGTGKIAGYSSSPTSVTYSANKKQITLKTTTSGGNVTAYVYAQALEGYVFDHWDVTSGTCTIADANSESTTVTMAAHTNPQSGLTIPKTEATITAVFAAEASNVDVSYTVKVVNSQSAETTIAEGVTASYSVTSLETSGSNYPLNYSYTLGTEPAVVSTSPAEAITLSMPNLPRGYNFLGWYKNSIANVISTNRTLSGQVFTEATTMGAKLLKKTTHGVTFESASNGSYSVTSIADKNNSTIPEDEYDEENIVGGSAIQIYSDDKITLQATPVSGCAFYRWYYRAGTSTRVTLTPTTTNTTNDVTTAQVTIPANATAIGVEFKQKRDFKVSYKSAVFTQTDYTLYVGGLLNPVPNAEDVTRTLCEGESIDLSFNIAPGTTRGVRFNGWYYTISESEDKHHISLAQHTLNTGTGAIYYTLTYETLAEILAQNPGKTVTFAVDVEKKATRNITFVSSANGSYHASFMDANGNGTAHKTISNSAGSFRVAKDADDVGEDMYEDDIIRLERNRTDKEPVNVWDEEKGKYVFHHYDDPKDDKTDEYLFINWYWEDAHGNRTVLGEGAAYQSVVDNRLDVELPAEATKVGANFAPATTASITFKHNEYGTYKVKAFIYSDNKSSSVTHNITSADQEVTNLLMQGAITLKTPVAATGYAFSRWYYTTSDGIKKTLANQSEEITVLLPEGTTTVGADFVLMGDFSVSGLYFSTLTDAIQAAQSEVSSNPSSTSTIIVARDATVPAGNYTIPAKVVLLIPYKAEQYISGPVDRIATTDVPDKDHAYRKLTLANGAHLEVYGTIEVSGCQTTAQQRDVEISRPGGSGASYGLMQMDNGSSITLNDKSQLNAWGFIQGTGTIDARRGSSVREQFQINDWKTLITTCRMAAGGSINYQLHVLPINQYFIQNVEVKTTYHPGSRLFGQVSANVIGMKLAFNDVGIIGVKYSDKEKAQDPTLEDDVAVFLMDNADNSEDTWVCKWYDVENDQQVYDVNNSAYLGSLAMEINFAANGINIDLSAFGYGDIEGIDVDSRDFALPLTNNFKIHLKSGNLVVTQNTILLPGAVIEIDKKSTMTIAEDTVWNAKLNNNAGGWEYKPQTLYLYDANQWGKYVTTGVDDDEEFTTIFDAFNNYDLLFGYGSRVKFRPGGVPNVRDISSPAGLGDAQLIVHGTVDVKGYLKTTYGDKKSTHISSTSYDESPTPSETDGGAITSRVEDAGTIIFSKKAQSAAETNANNPNNFLWQVDKAKTDDYVRYVGNHIIPAWLKNEAGSSYSDGDGYTETADAPAGKSFCFIDIDGDNKGEWVSLTNDGCFVYDGTDYYAKPKEYVALANGKTANTDHTFSDKAGQGRLFILVDDCQWWEVEKKDNLYHCTNSENDTYYYWDDGDPDEAKHQWREKEFSVTWVNWNGDPLGVEDNDVVYNLNYGVTPKYLEEGNPKRADDVDYTYNFIGWTPEIVPVTGNATYTAVYEAIQKKYTIIFNDANGNEIERQQLALGESPSAPDISSISNSYWNPAIAVVSGNATYQMAIYPSTPSKFTVTWANYNGSTISSEQVTKDDKPVYSGSTPVKNLNNEYNYTWTGWQSPAGTYDTDDELPAVTANITYTATFSVEPKTHAIKFYQEDGTTQIGTTQNLAFGADPVIPNYSKAATAQYTYTLKWLDKDFESEDPEDYELAASVNVPSVTADASYKAYFTETLNKYTVTLQSNLPGKCSFTGAGTYDYNTNVTIAATPASGYEFVKWMEMEGDANLGTLPLTSDITLTAVLKESAAATPENLNVNNGEINVPAAANYMDLTIFSDGAEASGQLTGANNISLYGNANFVFKKNIKAGYWYSFAVPWRVDAQSGVYFGGSNTPAVLGKDFEIVYYDGAVRAAQGKVDACWVYLKNLSTKKILEPGKAYMIFIKHGSQSQIVFRKKVQEPLLTTSVNVEQYNASDVLNANWNAIANPALYSAYVYAGDSDPKGYYYISENDQFDWYHLNAEKLVVGEAVYIQAPEAGTIVVNNSSYAPVAAPRRERAEQATSFDVQIAAAGATKRADHISIQIDEDKEENKYVIGKDLTKFGVSARVAQMWIDRYDVKLSFNTIAPEGDATFFPMSIYAPKAGTYTIAIEREVATEDYALYLTYNGEAIWNLSEGAYTANLNKGTDANYGLRISAKAPQVVTGVDEAIVDAQGETRKVLINNQVFIIRGEKVYTIDGQLVK